MSDVVRAQNVRTNGSGYIIGAECGVDKTALKIVDTEDALLKPQRPFTERKRLLCSQCGRVYRYKDGEWETAPEEQIAC